MWEQASFSDKISFVLGGLMLIFMLILGIQYLSGNIDGPAPAPVEEKVDYDQLYRNCMESIEGYIDDGGNRWDNAAEACAMIGSSEG